MSGFFFAIGLAMASVADRHLGHDISSDVEMVGGSLCLVIQCGFNEIIRALKP